MPNIVGVSRGGRGCSPGSSSAWARLRSQNEESKVAALEIISASWRDGTASTGVIRESNITMNNISLLWGVSVRVGRGGGE